MLARPKPPKHDAAVQSIDAFITSVTAVPTGGTRSPLMTAMLRDELHTGGNSSKHYVLVVKSQGGAAQGVTDDRPLWFKDKFFDGGRPQLDVLSANARQPWTRSRRHSDRYRHRHWHDR